MRQQTGAALLMDCRAYEQVLSGSTGGYDVESYLVPGETPFGGFPQATNPPVSSTASTKDSSQVPGTRPTLD